MSSPTTRPLYTPELRFQQYKLLVDIVIQANVRRDRLQTYHLTVHAAALALLAGGLGVLSSSGATRLAAAQRATLSLQSTTPFIVIVTMVGVLLAVTWRLQLSALRRVTVARYQMLFNMELDLPYQMFMQEWERLGKGRHMTDTAIQRAAPLIVMLLYLVLAAAFFVAQRGAGG